MLGQTLFRLTLCGLSELRGKSSRQASTLWRCRAAALINTLKEQVDFYRNPAAP